MSGMNMARRFLATWDADDFPKEWVKNNPEECKKKIVAAFKKVEEELSKDKSKFGDKINRSELPAADSGL